MARRRSADEAPFEAPIGPDWRARPLWLGVGAWVLAVGASSLLVPDGVRDLAMLSVTPAALLVVPGAVAAARPRPRPELLARTAGHLAVVAPVGLLLGVLSGGESSGGVAWIAGFLGGGMLLLAAALVVFALGHDAALRRRADVRTPGARLLLPLLLLLLIAAPSAAVAAGPPELIGPPARSLYAVLLGTVEVERPAWAWVARALVLALVGTAALYARLLRSLHRGARR